MMALTLAERRIEVENDSRFTLLVADGIADDATLAVRWCLSHAAHQEIIEGKLKDPQVLLTLVRNEQEVIGSRRLVPLAELMTFITFPGPGEYTLHAWVVETWQDAQRRPQYLRRTGFGYDYSILHGGEAFDEATNQRLGLNHGHAEAAITVDAGFFAKPPADWLSNWVNRWYESKPVDQCAWRRRCLLAFSIQPPVMLVISLFGLIAMGIQYLYRSVIAAWWLLWGMRDLDWKSFRNLDSPTRYFYNKGSWYRLEGGTYGDNFRARRSVYFYTRDGKARPVICWLLAPPILLGLSLINWFWSRGTKLNPISQGWGGAGYAILITVGLALIIQGLYWLDQSIPAQKGRDGEEKPPPAPSARKLAKIERQRLRELARQARQQAERQAEYIGLACDQIAPDQRAAKLETLPPERRSIRLRFSNFKRKHCKPFAH